MLACITTAAVVGLEGRLVEVQVDIAHQGLPNFFLVGLPTAAVKEARERVRTAIKNSGLVYPLRRITANLAPAELPKQGPSYDLPLALAILVASGQLEPPAPGALFVGELSLDGQVRHTHGVLPMVATARAAGLKHVYVPAEDAAEAALLQGIEVIPTASLAEVVAHLRGDIVVAPILPTDLRDGHVPEDVLDLAAGHRLVNDPVHRVADHQADAAQFGVDHGNFETLAESHAFFAARLVVVDRQGQVDRAGQGRRVAAGLARDLVDLAPLLAPLAGIGGIGEPAIVEPPDPFEAGSHHAADPDRRTAGAMRHWPEHGGFHEAAIGAGSCAGPAVGAASLYLAPASPHHSTVAIGALLVVGLAGLVWLRVRQ